MQCIKSIIQSILTPPFCGICNSFNVKSRIKFICDTCFENIEFIKSPKCIKCSKPYDNSGSQKDSLCQECLERNVFFDLNVSLVLFNEISQKMITGLKYHNKLFFLDTIEILLEKKKESIRNIFSQESVIIPVPLTKLRYLMRGYNQSYLLAKIISKKFGVELFTGHLMKIKNTPPQALCERKNRLKNLKEAFYVDSKSVLRDKKVVLIDDVFTTGSTINECARVLKQDALVASVESFTFAVGKSFAYSDLAN